MAVNSFAEDKLSSNFLGRLLTHLIWVCDPDTKCECELTCHETKGFWEHCACCFLNISCFCVQIDILSWVTQKSFWCSILVTLRCWLPKKNIKTHDDWVLNCVLRRSEISCFQGSWPELIEHVSLGSYPFATLVQSQNFILFSQPPRCLFKFWTKSFEYLYPSLYVGRSTVSLWNLSKL